MNPDFAIVLNFKLDTNNINADALVKKARDIGVRAISGGNVLQEAADKYTIRLVNQDGVDLSADEVIDTLVQNRKNGNSTVINIHLQDGKISPEDEGMLEVINKWMHMFGHAFNESEISELTVDQDGFILQNRHANYQKYVFLKSPLSEKITVSGLSQEPNRVEWIQNRTDLKFGFEDNELSIALTQPEDNFEWQLLRIQAHRPEDDIAETKF